MCEACDYENKTGYVAPMFHECGLEPENGLCGRCNNHPATFSTPSALCDGCWKEWFTEGWEN